LEKVGGTELPDNDGDKDKGKSIEKGIEGPNFSVSFCEGRGEGRTSQGVLDCYKPSSGQEHHLKKRWNCEKV